MPSTPWAGRRATDSPRPAGRWTGRLRRSGSLARHVLTVRVGRRRRGVGAQGAVTSGSGTLLLHPPPHTHAARPETYPEHHGSRQRDHDPLAVDPLIADPLIVAPVSPAVPTATHPTGARTASAYRPRTSVPLLPGVPTAGRRLRFALVNGCTVASLLLGMTAIFLSIHGAVRPAALCLLGCVLFDGADGALARRLGVASPFGVQMDSLADMCSFGIATPVVQYAWLRPSAPSALVAGACAIVAACAAIRLARFNVSPRDGKFFCGVPTTMVAAMLGIGTLIGLRPTGAAAVAVVIALGLAMVTSFPYAKLARLVKLPPWLWLAPLVGLALDYRVTFAILVVAYVLSGPALWLHRRSRAAA